MTPLTAALAALAVVGLLCCSVFFSSAETAITVLDWITRRMSALISVDADIEKLYLD